MRYVILILLNLPVILLALLNTLTQYKLGRISKKRFKGQIVLWLVIFIVLILSFPTYNYLGNKPVLDASELSLFDIVETTAIIYLFYIMNDQRRKIGQNERLIRELHQEISIKLSVKDGKS